MSPEEMQSAVNRIVPMLERMFRWHDNHLPPEGVPVVQTEIGLFGYVGLSQPKVVEDLGDVSFTAATPHTKYVSVVSTVPTSVQKVHVLSELAHAIAKRLGAPPGRYVVEVLDPTRGDNGGQRVSISGDRDQAEMKKRKLSLDPKADEYKTIREPYSITLSWPADS